MKAKSTFHSCVRGQVTALLASVALLCGLGHAESRAAELLPGLVGHWQFEEGAGTTTTDQSGNGITGTLVNGPDWVPSPLGNYAIEFDTGSDGVDLGSPAALQVTGALTLSAWVYVDSIASSGRIIAKGGASGRRGWSLNLEGNNTWAFQIAGNATTTIAVNPTNVIVGQWVHVAGVYDPTVPVMRFYAYGMLVGERTQGVPMSHFNSPANAWIGRRENGTEFDGKIDEVRVFNRALTQEEIIALPEVAPTPLNFVTQPVDRTVAQFRPVTFSAAVSGSPPHFFQWRSNDVVLPNATGSAYTISNVTVEMSGSVFSVTVSNLVSSIVSSNAILTVTQDTNPPVLVSAGSVDGVSVGVVFSESVDPGTAMDSANYILANLSAGTEVMIFSAVLGVDGRTVMLTTEPLIEDAVYRVTVNDVRDLDEPPNSIAPNSQVQFHYTTLVGHWQFEEGGGGSTADSSGNGFTGTLVNGPVWVPGLFGRYALEFDGVNDRVDVGNPDAFQITGPMTLAAWVYVESLSGDGRIVTKGGGPGQRGWSLNLESGGVWAFQIAVSASVNISVDVATIPLRQWTHVAGVYDPRGPSMRLYTNGVLGGEVTDGVPASQHDSSLNVSIGARSVEQTFFRGRLDEVRIHTRAFTAEEIAQLARPRFLPAVIAGGEIHLDWGGHGRLESAPSVEGPWEEILPQPAPPYSESLATGENRVFRLNGAP